LKRGRPFSTSSKRGVQRSGQQGPDVIQNWAGRKKLKGKGGKKMVTKGRVIVRKKEKKAEGRREGTGKKSHVNLGGE